MIITRAPFRITLGGGSTDLPSYYRRFSGFVLNAAINKYVYINLHKSFWKKIILKYSQVESCDSPSEIRHPIIRETLMKHEIDSHVELCSMADIPAGTGLGSSSAFTVALLRALYAYKKRHVTPGNLAEEASFIEIDKLGEPIGKQDQYAAAFGGINCLNFNENGTVDVAPLNIDNDTLYVLEDHLLLFFTGYQRPASSILSEQHRKTVDSDSEMLDILHRIKEIGLQCKEALEKGDCMAYARLMNEHWHAKKKKTQNMSNDDIDIWYELAVKNGAIGGKLIGAGAGGFLMFFAEDPNRLRKALSQKGLSEVPFCFDYEGAKVLVNEDNYK